MSENMPGEAEIAEVWANVRSAGYSDTFTDTQRASKLACAIGFFEQTIRDLSADLQAKQKKEPEDYQEAVQAWRKVAISYKDERDAALKALEDVKQIIGSI